MDDSFRTVASGEACKFVIVYKDDGTGGLPRGMRWMLDHPRLWPLIDLARRLGIAKSPIVKVIED